MSRVRFLGFLLFVSLVFSIQGQASTPLNTFAGDDISSFEFSADGKEVLVAGDHGISIFDVDTGECLGKFPDVGAVKSAAFLPHKRQIIVSSANQRFILDVLTGEFVSSSLPDFYAIQFHPDGNQFALGIFSGSGSIVNLYDTTTYKMTLTLNPLASSPLDISFSPDGTKIAFGMDRSLGSYTLWPDYRIRVYSLLDQSTIMLSQESGAVSCIVFAADSRHVICGKGHSSIEVWDIESGEKSRLIRPGGNVIDMAVSPDGLFLLAGCTNSTAYLHNFETGEIIEQFPSTYRASVKVAYSPTGRHILTLGQDRNSVHLWDVSPYLPPDYETPTARPTVPTPTQTPTPTCTIPPTPTPVVFGTPTPMCSPLPVYYEHLIPSVLCEDVGSCAIAVHPITGEVYFRLFRNVYVLDPQSSHRNFWDLSPVNKFPNIRVNSAYSMVVRDMEVDPEGNVYGFDNSVEKVIRLRPNGSYTIYEIPTEGHINALHIVQEGDRIPGATAGDILVLQDAWGTEREFSRVWKFNPGIKSSEVVLFLESAQLPSWIQDFTIGPEGYLYFVSTETSRIFRLDDDGIVRDFLNIVIPGQNDRITYLSKDHAFYTLAWDSISRVSEDGRSVQYVGRINSPYFGGEILSSPEGDCLYVFHAEKYGEQPGSIQALRYSDTVPTPTQTPTATCTIPPTPIPPTATPISILGWFVLDGFGGIHSANPDVKAPLLPYFLPYNIARDLEPDPSGKGWYMLDGLGGIHRSSIELPAPVGLPYFGFDIARNLEIKQTDAGLQFYLLDGFGVVHTTDPEFKRGYLPWFAEDLARDLEPDPKEPGWLVLDGYGWIYPSARSTYDLPLHLAWTWAPLLRGLVCFPDETVVLIDGYGGRFTNPYHPATNVIDGLPPYFYFPGFDIIWDVELIQERN